MILGTTVVDSQAYVVGVPTMEVMVKSPLSIPSGELEMFEEFALLISKCTEIGYVSLPPDVEAMLYAKLPFVQIDEAESPGRASVAVKRSRSRLAA